MSLCTCGCGGACGELPTRFPISNPAGLNQIAYRAGDFATFRRALLQHLPGETELDIWRPTAGADLGLQVLDWWAYIADILTFYNERIANEDYLGTAQLDSSVRQLVGLLGYRPRPGIGATGTLAVIAGGPAPLVIPAQLGVASKATPAIASQTFETTAATTFTQPTSVNGPSPDDLTDPPPTSGPPASAGPGAAEPPPYSQLIARGGVLVKGVPTSISLYDRLLLMKRTWTSANDPAVVVTVTGMIEEKDPHGRKNTRVLLAGTGSLPATAAAADYRLARSARTGHLSTLPSNATVIGGTSLVLDGPARYLKAGDPLLIEVPEAGTGASPGAGFDLVRLTQYAEVLWYANAPDPTKPQTPPTGTTPGIPLLVATLTVAAHTGANLAGYSSEVAQVSVRASWTDVGILLDTPAATLTSLPSTLTLARPPAATPGVATAAMVEDANGNGAAITATAAAGSADVTVAAADGAAPMPNLQAPVRILWDLINVSRGQTVRGEQLGVGNAAQAGQDFTLSKSPVTYLADAPGRSGDGYSSTVTLTVGEQFWTEVPMLYGHGPDEAIFETYEDDSGMTHVRTGTGETGLRLPTGAQVSATYRVGSGSAVPAAGSLSQVLTAVPNLRSVRNPVPPSGGADPEPASDARVLAPRSVLTFGRAISGDDYATVAAAAPGVARAAAAWEWDAAEQRPTVRVYVGDDAGALASAKTALAAQADPNRPVDVVPAVPCVASLSMALRLDPSYQAAAVYAQVGSALVDGLFAPGVLALGEVLYRSRIEEAVCAIPGVLATHHLRMTWSRGGMLMFFSTGPRFDPGSGGFFTLTAAGLALSEEAGADD
jgi:predicted phage baseplate assembly protein